MFGDQGMVECENGTPFVPEISLRPVCVDIGGFLEDPEASMLSWT